ncbi:MAG: hypothetical protein ACRENB_15970 [Gemmatimonadales bacterium]
MTTTRRSAGLALAAALFAGTACNEFLEVTNPGAIPVGAVADTSYVGLLVNGVIGEFQPMMSFYALTTSVFSDETRNNHVFFENRDIDKRSVAPENGTYALFVYNRLQRTRFLADTAAGYLQQFPIGPTRTDTIVRRIAQARVLAYGGHAYVLLAEGLCSAPVNLSAPLSSAELFTEWAIPRFTRALTLGAEARALATTAAQQATADSLLSLARVGIARAYLGLGNMTKAAEFAALVPAAFEFRVLHSLNSTRENSPFFNAASQGAASTWISLEAKFKRLGDPRVPSPANPEAVMDGLRSDTVGTVTGAFVPNSPSSFSGYAANGVSVDFTASTSMRFASGLEAQYIAAEANGPTAATLTFVNARRAAGGQAATSVTGNALMAELRDQRRRDFFLDGHRLGDMRRYLQLYSVNEFPVGLYPYTTTGETYGAATCLPLTLAEIQGNPNVPR